MANKSPAKRKPFYEQNDRFLPIDPPNYLGTVARSVWTKIIPYLKATEKVERIDTFLVETYCTNYEIYKKAYEDVKENGIQTEIKTFATSDILVSQDFTPQVDGYILISRQLIDPPSK